MINYSVQILMFQILFLAVYDLFLSKETFFVKNRIYLISTAILSFILPVLPVSLLQEVVPKSYAVLLPEVIISPQKILKNTVWYKNIEYLQILFWSGVVVFSILFSLKLISILKLIFSNEVDSRKNYKLVWLPKNSKAFSFFHYIFLGKEISKEKQHHIIQHELVHSRQKHSLDLLFFELLKIIMWFNPMIYVYQKRIALVHEFISDEIVAKVNGKPSYINNLLSEVFQVEQISFINQFYKHSFTKKRVIMMTKNKSKNKKQLKYLLLFPVLISMVLYVSCANESEVTDKNKEIEEVLKMLKTAEENEDIQAKAAAVNKLELLLEQTKKQIKDTHFIKEIETSNEEVPFNVIDKSPRFPNSVVSTKTEFTKQMQQHVQKHFNIKMVNNLGLMKGKKRIWIAFKITSTGMVANVNVRAPHPVLKNEAERIVSLLPQFIPAEKDGKKVQVGYYLPITFIVE